MESKKLKVREMVDQHRKLVDQFEQECLETIAAAANMLIDCLYHHGCVYACGNGGSAADAQHLAAELVGRFRRERKGLAAVALTTDTSVLTSVSNDYGFENIFARQVEALVRKEDVLVGFSTSGTSKNVLRAVEKARQQGAYVLSFTGKKNTPLEQLSDHCICVEGPTSTVQEVHQLAYHILCDLVESYFESGT